MQEDECLIRSILLNNCDGLREEGQGGRILGTYGGSWRGNYVNHQASQRRMSVSYITSMIQ